MADAPPQPSVSIVALGMFNPPMMSPAWLEKVGLISSAESEQAEVQLIHRDVSALKAGNFAIDVRRNRFSIEVTEEPYVAALDAMLLIFGENLRHTDISEVGINYNIHFSVGDGKKRLALGRKLAPLEPWGEFGTSISAMDKKDVSGVVDLVMVRHHEPTGSGQFRVQIEPSALWEVEAGGVFMTINDHRVVMNFKEADGPDAALELLSASFDAAVDEAAKIVEHIQTYARGL